MYDVLLCSVWVYIKKSVKFTGQSRWTEMFGPQKIGSRFEVFTFLFLDFKLLLSGVPFENL